jgi:hypothetical protein
MMRIAQCAKAVVAGVVAGVASLTGAATVNGHVSLTTYLAGLSAALVAFNGTYFTPNAKAAPHGSATPNGAPGPAATDPTQVPTLPGMPGVNP